MIYRMSISCQSFFTNDPILFQILEHNLNHWKETSVLFEFQWLTKSSKSFHGHLICMEIGANGPERKALFQLWQNKNSLFHKQTK